MEQKKNSSHVQSVARALEVLEVLARDGKELSLTEISGRLGWPKSTVHGLLATLRDYHYIDQSEGTGHYRLGVRLFELGNIVARSWDIHDVALPHMQKLNARLGEMIQLAVEDDGEVLYLEKVDSSHMMRIVSDIGGRQPMHCTGLGKVLLAYKSEGRVQAILKRRGMPRMTERTITTPAQLALELAKIRERGYGMDDREVMEGLRCVAAPIRDREGIVKYAVSASALWGSLQGERLEQVIELVKQCAADISYAMGCRSK